MSPASTPQDERPITGIELLYADQAATKALLLAALEAILGDDPRRAEKGAEMARIGAALVDASRIPSGPTCDPTRVRAMATAEVERVALALGRLAPPRRR